MQTLPPVVRVLNEAGAAPFVLICEHAARFLPPQYHGLGLSEAELQRHITWDIGAEMIALRLSALLDAPLVLAGYSRLLIDLNRPTQSKSSTPEISETTVIPGNVGLSETERRHRIETYFDPFQARVAQLLDARQAASRPTKVIAIHSFTPVFAGVARPWRAGILYRRSQAFGAALVEALGGENEWIAHNQPYQIDDESDYTVPVHGENRGLDAVLVEIRQDLTSTEAEAHFWADELALALPKCLSKHLPSSSASLPQHSIRNSRARS